MSRLPSFIVVIAITAMASGSVHAHIQLCDSRNLIERLLKSRYNEVLSAQGLSSNGNLIELFTSDTDDWTLIVTNSFNISCIISTGESWRRIVRQSKPNSTELKRHQNSSIISQHGRS